MDFWEWLEGIPLAFRCAVWLASRVMRPSFKILSPSHTWQIKNLPWVSVSGRSSWEPAGHYWLITTHDNNLWTQQVLNFSPQGKWDGRVNVGNSTGERPCAISVVWASEAMHAVFEDYKRKGLKSNIWEGLSIRQSLEQKDMIIMDALSVLVRHDASVNDEKGISLPPQI